MLDYSHRFELNRSVENQNKKLLKINDISAGQLALRPLHPFEQRPSRSALERAGTRRPLRHQEVLLLPPRSMIAKLPGDKKLFMGEHIELVCLLQAA